MKQKNLIEISEETLTALVVVRQKNGQVDFAVCKGNPNPLEQMTLLFGVFTAMVKSLDNIKFQGLIGSHQVREMFKHHSLEECREIFAISTNVLDVMKEEEKSNE